jgi:hypothetical protein
MKKSLVGLPAIRSRQRDEESKLVTKNVISAQHELPSRLFAVNLMLLQPVLERFVA